MDLQDYELVPEAPVLSDPSQPSPQAFAGVPEPLRAPLEARGFDRLTAVQRAVLEAEAGGRDLQISSQTGSGKTVALGFALAPRLIAERAGEGPEALIIVPTRELATQVCEELGWLFAGLGDLRVASVTGGSPVYLDRKLLERHPRVLVGTPGRLLDHVTSGVLDLGNVCELVLDEADQMLDMGFREELEGILDKPPDGRRTHLVSATFPAGIQRLAARYQREPLAIEGTRLGDANQDIEHRGHLVQLQDRYAAMVNILLLAGGERTLVFVERRSDAVEVAERLESDGFEALPLSGELAQSQRERTLAAFRAGRVRVLVATDVAARGLDVPDVATVIHTAPPIDAQVYTHRSGRTGRAGKRGTSILFAPPNRKRRVARLLADAGVELQWLPIPPAAQVREELERRNRETLERELDLALAAGPKSTHLQHAEDLIQGRDATELVAALLGRIEPAQKVEPRDVETARPKERCEGPQRQDYGKRKGMGPGRGFAGGTRPRRSQHGNGNAVRFFVNWGVNQGATPGRLLAAVCRRGEVSGEHIGSIAIHPNASTFDVRADVAERFERLAGRRDPRDPQTHIRRDRGPQAAPERRQRAPAYKDRRR